MKESTQEHVNQLEDVGYAIIPDALSAEGVAEARTAVEEILKREEEIARRIGTQTDYLCFYLPQTSQQIFQSTPGISTYGDAAAEATGATADQKSLLHYLSQPIRLLEEMERTVDTERELYELDASRY